MAGLLRIADRLHRWRAQARPRRGRPDGLMLVSAGGLGDTILFAHVIDAFCAYAGPAEPITVVLRKDGARTAFLFPDRVDTFVVDFGRYRRNLAYRLDINRQLYDKNFRAAVSTDFLRHPDLDESLLLAAGAAETVAMVAKPWAKYQRLLDRNGARLSRLYDSGPARRDKLLRWFDFAGWLTGQAVAPSLKALARHPAAPSQPPFVYIQAFSAVKAKQCGPEVYGALIDALPDDAQIRLTGAPGDMAANPEFQTLLARPNVAFEDAGFAELLPLLQRARLVVSVDTAVMHLSAAIGAPTLCLASAAYVGEIVPYPAELTPDTIKFYYKSMECEGCLGSCIKSFQNGRFPCIAELETAGIVRQALVLFDASAGPPATSPDAD